MFPAGHGKWEPYKVRKVNKPTKNTEALFGDGDVAMGDADTKKESKEEDEESEYEEDLEGDEGAVYPLKGKHQYSMRPTQPGARANICD